MRLFAACLAIAALTSCIPATSEAKLRVEKADKPESFCQGCKSMVSFINRFNSSLMRDAHRDVLNRFCEFFYPATNDFQLGPCPMYVEGVFNVLSRIDPVNYCDDLGACGPTTSQGGFISNELTGSDALVCNVCTDVVKQVKEQIEDPKFIDQVHHTVDTFCEYLTVIDADKECRAALESYIDRSLEFIRQTKPKDLCRSLQFCSVKPPVMFDSATESQNSKKLPSLADFNNFGIETSVQVGDKQVKSLVSSDISGTRSPNCVFCKMFVKEMFKFLKDNRTEESIRNALDNGCELIYRDKESRAHCEDLVKAYTKELLELLVDETNPEVICVLLDQCTYQTMPPTTTTMTTTKIVPAKSLARNEQRISMSQIISLLDPSIQVDSMRSCIECKLFIKYLQETLEKPSSQEEVKNWLLTNLCDNIDEKSVSEKCEQFVNQESAVFFKAVIESLNPKKSCVMLGACSARIRSNYLAKLKMQLQMMDSNDQSTQAATTTSSSAVQPIYRAGLCDQCVEIVTKVDDYLSTHPIDHDIAVLKDKVCGTIQDDNLRGECVMIIQTFGQEIIQAISEMDNPRQLCQKIALCSTSV